MDNASDRFDSAARAAKSLPETPDNETLLQLYALYKQASEGDAHGSQPNFFDFVATAKFQAWQKLSGMSQNDARAAYVDLVIRLNGDFE